MNGEILRSTNLCENASVLLLYHTIHPAQTPIIVIPFDLIRVNLLNKMNEINYNFCVGNRQTFMDHQLGCGEWNGINVA